MPSVLTRPRGPARQYPATPVVAYLKLASDSPPSMAPGNVYPLTVVVQSGDVPLEFATFKAVRNLGGRTVTGQSSDTGVATVSASAVTNQYHGLATLPITAVGAGSATITYKCEGVTLTVAVTVAVTQGAVATVTVSPNSFTITPTGQVVLSAVVRDASQNVLTGKTVTWATSNGSQATVSGDSGTEAHTATVTGVAAGSPTITATCEGVNGTCAITVQGTSTYFGAELPRVTPSYPFAMPTGTKRVVTGSGGSSNFQAVLNVSDPGDIIVLTAGTVYSGQFTIPERFGGEGAWLYIISDRVDAGTFSIAEGRRINISDEAEVPMIRTTASGGTPALVANGPLSGRVRLVGIGFDAASGLTSTGRFVQYGPIAPTSASQIPQHVVFDRCLFKGRSTLDLARAILLTAAYCQVTGCYFHQIVNTQQDCQCIESWNTTGKWLIENNFLGGSTECIMLGGSAPTITGAELYADITVRRNHFMHYLWQHPADPTYLGINYVVKNHFELKGGVRVLLENNLFENYWAEDQESTINVKTVTPAGGLDQLDDIIIRYNRFKNTCGPVVVSQTGANKPNRAVFAHNYCYPWNANTVIPDAGNAVRLLGANGMVCIHNTFLNSGPGDHNCVVVGGVNAVPAVIYRDNIFYHGTYGWKVSGYTTGTPSVNAASNSQADFKKNIMLGADSQGSYPASNAISPQPTAPSAIGFVNLATGDLRLAVSSPYYQGGSDGTDIGADVATVDTLTAGCESGVWS